MRNNLTDEALIRQYLLDQPNICFDMLYKRYVNKVYEKCLSITKNVAQSEDFTHDIFIKVFAHITKFQHRSLFSTWLNTITHNYCMDQLKKARRFATYPLDDQEDWNASEDKEAIDNEEVMQQLDQAVDSLPPFEQSLLRLKYQEKLSVAEIARMYKLNDSGVKMRLMRSRTKIKQFYLRQLLAS